LLVGHWAWGIGHGAWGIGHWAWGIGHGKNPINEGSIPIWQKRPEARSLGLNKQSLPSQA